MQCELQLDTFAGALLQVAEERDRTSFLLLVAICQFDNMRCIGEKAVIVATVRPRLRPWRRHQPQRRRHIPDHQERAPPPSLGVWLGPRGSRPGASSHRRSLGPLDLMALGAPSFLTREAAESPRPPISKSNRRAGSGILVAATRPKLLSGGLVQVGFRPRIATARKAVRTGPLNGSTSSPAALRLWESL